MAIKLVTTRLIQEEFELGFSADGDQTLGMIVDKMLVRAVANKQILTNISLDIDKEDWPIIVRASGKTWLQVNDVTSDDTTADVWAEHGKPY